MERNVMSSKRVTGFLAGIMALAVALTLSVPTGAYAATYGVAGADLPESAAVKAQAIAPAAKSKTVKNVEFTTSTSKIKKKATAVKKGTTKLKVKSGQGYIKFTATKKKAYSFTFSNLKSSKVGAHVYGAFVEVQTPNKTSPKYSPMTEVATKGGKTTALWLAEKGYQRKTGKLVYRYLTTRTGKIKLDKGQDIYFYFYSGSKNSNVTLKVA